MPMDADALLILPEHWSHLGDIWDLQHQMVGFGATPDRGPGQLIYLWKRRSKPAGGGLPR